MNDFPDIETLLMGLLASLGTCVTATGPTLDTDIQTTPTIRIVRTGGGDDRITDKARVSIDVFAKDWATAQSTAEAVRQALLVYPIKTSLGVIDEVITNTGPAEIPWDNPRVFRRNASFTISMRR